MGKNYRNLILEILSEAENGLLEIVSRAATLGDYSGIDLARGTAGEIKRISIRLSTEQSDSATMKTRREEKKSQQRKRDSFKKTMKKSGYPRFEIKEATLTKVGWSKKKKKEYSHHISREVFDVVVSAISASRRDTDGPLSTELIREVLGSRADGAPSYQMYSVLGFLRSRDVIRPSARGAYVIPCNVSEKAQAEWHKAEEEGT